MATQHKTEQPRETTHLNILLQRREPREYELREEQNSNSNR